MDTTENSLVVKTVQLGNVIRRQRLQGSLQSVAPPTIYGYLAFLRMAHALPHLSLQQVAMATLLGNASLEDRKVAAGAFNETFGLNIADADDPTLGGSLF
jgi:hypothetical protein